VVTIMDRSNPYEAAFEAYLRAQGLCYVAVDEARRAMLGDSPVKNLDFIVHGIRGARLLVDVKGRQFPGGPAAKPRYVWENWATQEDVLGLRRWASLFGPNATALFVFLYRLLPTVEVPAHSPDLFRWRGDHFLLRGVTVEDYLLHMRVRSPKWGTVGVPGAAFRTLARPFRYFTHELTLPETPSDAALEDRPWPEALEPALAAAVAGPPEAGGGGA
jgi:hypothetical protein